MFLIKRVPFDGVRTAKTVLCAALFLWGAGVWAENIPQLPSAKGSETEFYLTARNFVPYQDLLLAPVATWLKEGRFVMRAAADCGFAWRYTEKWQGAGGSALLELTPTNGLALSSGELPPPGLLFGDAEMIDREADPSKQAAKILWNIHALSGVTGDLLTALELGWFNEKMLVRKAEGIFYRQFAFQPAAPADAATPPQFLGANDIMQKEYLNLYSPPVVFGFAALTWRYRGAREDDVWIYSPVVGRSRRVFEANRSDPLLDGLLTLEDFFVWSARVESVDAQVVDEKQLFVPFLATDAVRLQSERSEELPPAGEGESLEGVLTAAGPYRRVDGRTAAVIWNFESSRFLQLPPWIPTSVIFVPRKVWIIELSPRDPFSVLGRQVLVVDKEMMLPVYKVVYDRKGLFSRLVIGSWHLAVLEKKQIRLPFSGMTLAVDRSASRATALTTLYVRTFASHPSPMAVKVQNLLDIQAHEKRGAQNASAHSKSASASSSSAASAVEDPDEAAPED